MTPKQRTNIICAVICFLFGAIYFYFTVNLHPGALIGEVSTKFVPKLLAAVMAFLSVLLFLPLSAHSSFHPWPLAFFRYRSR